MRFYKVFKNMLQLNWFKIRLIIKNKMNYSLLYFIFIILIF